MSYSIYPWATNARTQSASVPLSSWTGQFKRFPWVLGQNKNSRLRLFGLNVPCFQRSVTENITGQCYVYMTGLPGRLTKAHLWVICFKYEPLVVCVLRSSNQGLKTIFLLVCIFLPAVHKNHNTTPSLQVKVAIYRHQNVINGNNVTVITACYIFIVYTMIFTV